SRGTHRRRGNGSPPRGAGNRRAPQGRPGPERTAVQTQRRLYLAHISTAGAGAPGGTHYVGSVAADPDLYNEDLAPVPMEKRTWTGYSIFAMWMSDVHSVGGYTFAASLFLFGLTGWQVLAAMAIGIMIVYFLMNLIGRPSIREGIPFT